MSDVIDVPPQTAMGAAETAELERKKAEAARQAQAVNFDERRMVSLPFNLDFRDSSVIYAERAELERQKAAAKQAEEDRIPAVPAKDDFLPAMPVREVPLPISLIEAVAEYFDVTDETAQSWLIHRAADIPYAIQLYRCAP